jgi:hypothetical protein
MMTYRAVFSDGHILTDSTKVAMCVARSFGSKPSFAWRGVMKRSNGTLFEASGFCANELNAQQNLKRFRRDIKPREPSFTEIVPAEAMP